MEQERNVKVPPQMQSSEEANLVVRELMRSLEGCVFKCINDNKNVNKHRAKMVNLLETWVGAGFFDDYLEDSNEPITNPLLVGMYDEPMNIVLMTRVAITSILEDTRMTIKKTLKDAEDAVIETLRKKIKNDRNALYEVEDTIHELFYILHRQQGLSMRHK